ncbi:50S ribosomal protein L11 methyltransferase [Acetobacter sp. AN02]|uniref:class I SAM-dependent methyltransferase n=1 Tax=Acetobacter sp. AN02 TaxID=2894186 RepID=UPI0024344635|nr:50S ribosomal protein L11 methyltransferase [Acetobacter sp. AN02]MDG6093665.1 50S ribosomal protein L11 methyltransferase [Acetobacter sp. AN02]
MEARDFIFFVTEESRTSLVPEIPLRLATEITPVWQASEAWLEEAGAEPPFWAFAWPGSQALARYVLDEPSVVAGLRVLDFAAGCGLAGIACALAGAASVEAAEIDPLAVEAVRVNAERSGVTVRALCEDMAALPDPECQGRWDIILCGDVCYEAPMTAHIMPWLLRRAREIPVLLADPGRNYCPAENMTPLFVRDVPTIRELEDRDTRRVTVFRVG